MVGPPLEDMPPTWKTWNVASVACHGLVVLACSIGKFLRSSEYRENALRQNLHHHLREKNLPTICIEPVVSIYEI